MTLLSDLGRSLKLDVMCITETHLLQHISDSFVQIPGYSLLRNDVEGRVYKHGVCAYVRENIAVGDVSAPIPNILTFCLVSYNVSVVVVYRPPSNCDSENERVCSFLRSFCAEKEVILMGDFNLPSLVWCNGTTCITSGLSKTEHMFVDLFDSTGLTQWVSQPTYPRSGNVLDLVLTSESDRISQLEIFPPIPGCDHCPTCCDYVFYNMQSNRAFEELQPHRRAWSHGHYVQMCQELSSVDWDLELAYLDANESFNQFATIVSQMTELHVPIKNLQHVDRVPWKTRPPTSLSHRRQAAWQTYKRVRLSLGRNSKEAQAAYKAFSGVNKEVRTFAVKSQCDYELSLITRSKDNPKLLHAYIRNKKVGRASVGPLLLPSGSLTDDAYKMAELFASSFASVFTVGTPVNPASQQVYNGTLSHLEITSEHVRLALAALDSNSAMGPDNLHPHLLKQCAAELAYPLQIIFSRSLQEGRLPECWKSSLVIPIFKKGSRSDPLNYRPISLTSVVCKTMERLVCAQLRSYLEDNSLLNSNQFGFRTGRGTIDQLLLAYNTVSINTDLGGITDVILFDFSKAFDVVCHGLMIEKLKSIGLQDNLLDWICSFLQGRQMRVCVRRSESLPRPVTSGVPQGSVLGPLLFLIYIDSIASQLTSEYKIFADDLKLYACVNLPLGSTPSSTALVQRDINTLQATAASWCLKINPNKCAVLRFTRPRANSLSPAYFLDGLQIPHVESHRDLGVTVDSDLKFHEHIRTVVHKASGLAQSFLKSSVCRSPSFMLFLFTTHIRPIIEYCSCLWHTGYVDDLRALERIQRRWTKRINGLETLSYADRLHALDLYSVHGRLLRADLIQYWKIFNGKSCIVPDDLFVRPPQTRTRGHRHRIFPTVINTDVRKRFFSVRCIAVWNSLPDNVVCAPTLTSFKKFLGVCLHDSLYAYA